MARRLAEEGFKVLAGVRAPAAMKPLPGVEALPLDVTDPASRAAGASFVKARHGRLDVLVNNAGILLDGTTGLMDLEADLLRRLLSDGGERVRMHFLDLLQMHSACLGRSNILVEPR